MRQDKIENDAKEIVKEKTGQTKRSDAWRKKPEKPGDSGTCSRICGVIWRTPRIQKKDEPGEAEGSSRIVALCNSPLMQYVSRRLRAGEPPRAAVCRGGRARGFCHRKEQDEIKDIHLGLPKSD